MNKEILKVVKVIIPNIRGKAIVQSGNDLYIVPSRGFWTNQEIQIDLKDAVKVISLLYGIDMLFNNNFDEVVEFIKENW
jgi:hypothetical protein